MVPDNEIVVTKLENKCNFISNFFVLMHFTGQKKKSNGVIHSVKVFKIITVQFVTQSVQKKKYWPKLSRIHMFISSN